MVDRGLWVCSLSPLILQVRSIPTFGSVEAIFGPSVRMLFSGSSVAGLGHQSRN